MSKAEENLDLIVVTFDQERKVSARNLDAPYGNRIDIGDHSFNSTFL